MSLNVARKAVLTLPKPGFQGRRFSVRGRLVGHDGVWFRVGKKGEKNYRVVALGSDGKAEDISYLVAAGDFEVIDEVDLTPTPVPETSIVARNGSVVLAVRYREKLGLNPGARAIQEEKDGGILVRPFRPEADGPRRPTAAERDELISRITPENVHDEFDTGGPVGREVL